MLCLPREPGGCSNEVLQDLAVSSGKVLALVSSVDNALIEDFLLFLLSIYS
jgi:hypothetical protein